MKNNFLLICIALFAFSCKNGANSSEDHPAPQFSIKELPIIELPLKAGLNSGEFGTKCPPVENPPAYLEKREMHLLGVLADTSEFYPILYSSMGSDYSIPILRKYSKTGELTDSLQIGYTKCGSGGDCGFECEDFIEILESGEYKYMQIVLQSECDEDGNVLEGTGIVDTVVRGGRY